MKIDCEGQEGNAFTIIGVIKSACQQTGKDSRPIVNEMMSGDYNNVLDVADREFPHLIDWMNDPREA